MAGNSYFYNLPILVFGTVKIRKIRVELSGISLGQGEFRFEAVYENERRESRVLRVRVGVAGRSQV